MGRTIAGVLAGLLFVGVLVMALAQQASIECEVCIEFEGRQLCRTNRGADRDQAIQGATTSACAVLASGVTRGIQCSNTPPSALRCNSD